MKKIFLTAFLSIALSIVSIDLSHSWAVTVYDSGKLSNRKSLKETYNAPNISASERQVLIDLYNETYPDVSNTWKKEPLHTDNFSMPGTECSWEGIKCYNGGNYITEINLENKGLRGVVPETITSITNLKVLNISQNNIKFNNEVMAGLPDLESLDLSYSSLSLSLLKAICQLTNLKYLNLSNCYFSATIPATFSNLNQLQYLDISNNYLQGNIFNLISNFQQLETLDIHNNNFEGLLPQNLNNPNLKYLDASDNKFWGLLPNEINQLKSLTHLILSQNSFSGAIPNELFNLANLQVLKLDRNQFTGEIPESFLNFSQLKDYQSDLSYNGLFTRNSQLQTFLNQKQIDNDWMDTQTSGFDMVSYDEITDTSLRISWSQVTDTFPGGIEVSYAKEGEPFVSIYPLLDKTTQETTIKNLLPNTQYEFRIRNCTKSHNENSNKIYSDYSSFSIMTTGSSTTIDQYIKEGRQYIRNASYKSIIMANNSFENVLSLEPGHEEGILFHAITRFAPLLDIDASYTAGMPIENLKELMDVYGVDQQGRDINNWFADIQRDNEWNKTIPDNSPSPEEIQKYIQSVWISEIDASLDELSSISNQFNLILLKEDICDRCNEDIELDYAEVLMLKSALNLIKTVLYMSISYNIDVNLKEILEKIYADIINMNSDLLDKYTSLFMLVSGGQEYMSENARSALLNAIDLYFEASEFIRSETDSQENDLLSFDRGDSDINSDEETFRTFLTDLKKSIEDRTLLSVGTVDETWEFINEKDQKIILSLEFDSYGTFQEGSYASKYMMSSYGKDEFLGFTGNITSFTNENNSVNIDLEANFWQECPDSGYCSYWNTKYCFGSGTFTGKMTLDKETIYDGNYTIVDCEGTRTGTFTASRIDKTEDNITANIGEFFADPIHLREYLPEFKHNPYNNEVLINGISTISDRTYSGVYPDRAPRDHNGAFLDKFYVHSSSDKDVLEKMNQYFENYFLSNGISESELINLSMSEKCLLYYMIQYRYEWRWDFHSNFSHYFNIVMNDISSINADELNQITKYIQEVPQLKVKFSNLDIRDVVSVSVIRPYSYFSIGDYYNLSFGGSKIIIDMDKFTTISNESELIIFHPMLLGSGKYTVNIIDSNGNKYSESRKLILNSLEPFNEQSILPKINANISVPQTFSWEAITDKTIQTIYYQVKIYLKNAQTFVPIYMSSKTTDTSITLPEDILATNTFYYWQVVASDGSDNINSHNLVMSNKRGFYTGSDSVPLTINKFEIQSNVLPDIDQTLIKVFISNARPLDFTEVSISGPEQHTFSISDAKMLNNGGYLWTIEGIIPIGNYQCSITDQRNSELITKGSSFSFKRLPDADLISPLKNCYTTTPRLQWFTKYKEILYYSAEVFDITGNSIYKSDKSTALYADIPENVLKENQMIQWQVHVYDSLNSEQNMSSTNLSPLFVKSFHPIIGINGPGAVVESNLVLEDAISIKLPSVLSKELVIQLTSSDTSEIQVPQSVVIPVGKKSVSVDITVIDDAEQDSLQDVTINATAENWIGSYLKIQVLDNDISADHYVNLGRESLSKKTHQSIIESRNYFSSALAIHPNNEQANFFYAIARIAGIFDMNTPYEQGLPIESLNELLDSCGVDSNGRDIFNWTAEIYETQDDYPILTDQCPSPQAIIDYFDTVFLSEIDGALDNLSKISDSFETIISKDEMSSQSIEDVEVDYGEVLILKSALYAIKSVVLTISSYNYDVQNVQMLVNKIIGEEFHINDDLLNIYPELFALLPGKANQISTDAKENLLNSIDTYFSAYTFITSEKDDQSNDLLSFDGDNSEYREDEESFRDYLTDIKSSIINNEIITIGDREYLWEISTSDNLGGSLQVKIKTDLKDNFDYGEWFASETNYYNSSYIGYGGIVKDFSQTAGNVKLTIQNFFWNNDKQMDCELDLQFNATTSLGYMTGNYSGMICNESKSGTFSATIIDTTEDKQNFNPGEFYNDPISPREYFPEFTQDPYTDKILVNGLRTYPDRTFSDIYPDMAPEDIQIDRVGAYVVYSHGTYLEEIFSLKVNGLAPWMLKNIYFNGQPIIITPKQSAFDTDSQLYVSNPQPFFGASWNIYYNVQDIDDKWYKVKKYFTLNTMPMTETIIPDQNAYINSTTPVFYWSPVMDDQVGNNLFYKVIILDTTENRTIYSSESLKQNELILPQGILQENSTYKWQILVMDGPDPVSMNNYSVSKVNTFFTGEQQTLAFEKVNLENITLSSGTTITRLKLKLANISKIDIQQVELNGPETKVLNQLDSKDTMDGSYYWDVDMLPQGTYTIKVTDARDSSFVSIEKTLETKSIEAPSNLGLANQSTITTTMPVLTWEQVSGANYYNAQILNYSDHIIYESPTTTQTSLRIPENVLKEYTAYQWRVQTLDSQDSPQNIAQSETREFYISKQNNILSFSIPEIVNKKAGVVYAKLSVPVILNDELIVQLNVNPSGTDILSLPDNVTIEANNKSVQVPVTLNENATVDGSKPFTITVSSVGYVSDTKTVLVSEVTENVPVVSDIPDQNISKFQSFSSIALNDFVLDMDHSLTEISWYVEGQSNISVEINNNIAVLTIKDSNWVGSETLTFTAVDPDGLSSTDSASFTVSPVRLYISMNDSVSESDEKIKAAIYLNEPFSQDLVVNLSSSDTSEMTVPSTITIPAGSHSVEFDVSIVNDTDQDGSQTAIIQASASGWESAVQNVTIKDDEISVDQLISDGRESLSQHNQDSLIAANESFQSAVSKDPDNAEANFFFAITRLLSLLNSDSYTPGLPIENANELLDRYGASSTGRDIFNFDVIFYRQLMDNNLSFENVQKYLKDILLVEINGALENLSIINSSFTTILTNAETGDYLTEDVEVDYGDVLIFRSMLNALKTVIYIVCAYDIAADVDNLYDILQNDTFDINKDLFEKYQSVMSLLSDGETLLSIDAKSALLKSIDDYFKASEFIRSETDDQEDDLMSIDQDIASDELDFRADLAEIEESLQKRIPAVIGKVETRIEEEWKIELQTTGSLDPTTLGWRISKDEMNNLIEGDNYYYYQSYSCINGTYNGCSGDFYYYNISGNTLEINARSYDGSTFSFSGTLSGNESDIITGSFSATYFDGSERTISGNFTGTKERSETDEEDNQFTVNVGEFFDDPINIREYKPELANDPYTNDILIVSESSFPDRTFSGILPDKWPTKGDVYIDKVKVFYDSAALYMQVFIHGIAPWEIKEIYVDTPQTRYPIPATLLNNDGEFVYVNLLINNTISGNYNFVFVDNKGKKYSKSKYFTRNLYNHSTSSDILPEKYANTTTPTFSWPVNSFETQVTNSYLLQIYSLYNPFEGRKVIHEIITENNQYTIPEDILKYGSNYQWSLLSLDYNNLDIANNTAYIVSDQPLHITSEPKVISISKATIRSEYSTEGLKTLLDLETLDWTNEPISITGPLKTTMEGYRLPFRNERAYTIISGKIPDGTYTFSIEKAGEIATYSTTYIHKSIPIAQNLTVSNEDDIIYTTMPVFKWSPILLKNKSLYSNLQIYGYNTHLLYNKNLIYESTPSLNTEVTIPPDVLKANNAYYYRVMVYDDPINPQNVSVTDFQRLYIKMTSPLLILSVPSKANEKDGTLVKQGKISLNKIATKDLYITLSSDDTSEIIVPEQIIIPKGNLSIFFNIGIIDDDILDNDQIIKIEASADGWTSATQFVVVLDDDEDWKNIPLSFPTEHIDFNAIWGTGNDNIYVIGSPATIVHYDGYDWQQMELPACMPQDANLFDIYATDENNIIAVGSHTLVLKYNGSQWQCITSNEQDGFPLYGVWSYEDNIYAVGDNYLSYQLGKWSVSSQSGESIWGTIEMEYGQYTEVCVYIADSDSIIKNEVAESQLPSIAYQSIFGLSFNDIYAVGENKILHKNNGNWTVLSNPHVKTDDIYTSVWASAKNDILISGYHGAILNYIDGQWKRMQTGTTNKLNAIWGSSEKDVYAVGVSGTIIKSRPRNVTINRPPKKPIAVFPENESTINLDSVALKSNTFSDPDGDLHQKTIWRIRRADKKYYHPEYSENFTATLENLSPNEMIQHYIDEGLITGMKYYWQVAYGDDSDGKSDISWSDEFSFKVGTIDIDSNPPSIEPGEEVKNYKMISFPYWVKNSKIITLLKDIDSINTESNKIGTYLPSREGYVQGESLNIEPGRAYWFLSRKGLNFNIEGVKVSKTELIEIPLWYNKSTANGWNMIGAPNNKTYAWELLSIIVYDDLGNIIAGPYNVLSPEAIEYIDSRLWEWNNGKYEDDEEILEPYEGYWVRVKKSNVSLQFPIDASAKNTKNNEIFVMKQWIKKLGQWIMPSPLQAVSSEEPPMPMGLNASSESDDKCFIGVTHFQFVLTPFLWFILVVLGLAGIRKIMYKL